MDASDVIASLALLVSLATAGASWRNRRRSERVEVLPDLAPGLTRVESALQAHVVAPDLLTEDELRESLHGLSALLPAIKDAQLKKGVVYIINLRASRSIMMPSMNPASAGDYYELRLAVIQTAAYAQSLRRGTTRD